MDGFNRICEIHWNAFIITNHRRERVQLYYCIQVFKLVAKFRTSCQKKCYIHKYIERETKKQRNKFYGELVEHVEHVEHEFVQSTLIQLLFYSEEEEQRNWNSSRCFAINRSLVKLKMHRCAWEETRRGIGMVNCVHFSTVWIRHAANRERETLDSWNVGNEMQFCLVVWVNSANKLLVFNKSKNLPFQLPFGNLFYWQLKMIGRQQQEKTKKKKKVEFNVVAIIHSMCVPENAVNGRKATAYKIRN